MNGFNGFSLKEKLSNIWNSYRKYIIIISIVVLVMLIALIIVLSNKNNKQGYDYELVESVMVYSAKKYIENNEITKDMYISLNYLNIEIDSNLKCNSNSGVLVEDNNYTPYLMCEGYNSQVVANVIKENEENSKYGVLLGDNPYIVTDTYQELGISLVEGYTVNIKNSNIDNGINKVTYNILESGSYITHIDRIVIAEGILGSSPIIELVGNQTRTVELDTPYTESGYTATDKIDGNITDKVKVEGSVDTSKTGTYTLTYSVTNTRGKSVSVKRKVIVNDNSINLDITHTINPTEVTSTGVKITLDIKGEGYSYTIIDNGDKVISKNPTYTAYKNGTYEFTVYDNNNNSEVYSVEIKNIDANPPTGTCQVVYENNVTTITVNANDVSGIKEYEYIDDGNSLYTTNESKFTYKAFPTKPTIKITDNSLETTIITCSKENRSPQYYNSGLSSIITHSNGMRYYLYLPPNIDIREKVPFIIALHGGGGRHCAPIDGSYQYVKYDSWVTYPYLFNMIKSQDKSYPAIILFPERINCDWPKSSDFNKMNQIVDEIIAKYNVNENKISVLGHSQGGAGTLAMIVNRQNFFSVAVAISPAGTGDYNKNVFTTPTLFIVGDSEYQKIRAYVKEIKSNLLVNNVIDNFRFIEFENSDHDTDKALFLKTDIISWIIKQNKGQKVIFDDNVIKSKIAAHDY